MTTVSFEDFYEVPGLNFDVSKLRDDLEKILLLEQRFFLCNHNLNYTDKMSMISGVEVRVPFLDNDLVEYAATIPSKYKQRGLTGKWCLKQAMKPHLPDKIIFRKKMGFGGPLKKWLDGGLKDVVDDALSEDSIVKRGIFDHSGVLSLRKSHNTGQIDASYVIFALVCIELWCRRFIDIQASREKKLI